MSDVRVQTLPKEEYQAFLSRADEAERSMKADLESRRFNSAGLQAVQVAIASADAVTTFHLGIRSTAQSHLAVLDHLRRIQVDGCDQACRQIAAVLDKKNQVQYEPGTIPESQARDLAHRAERILRWAIQVTAGKT